MPEEGRILDVLEASFDGIGIAEDGVVIHVNHRMAEMFGIPREDFVGRPVQDFVAPEDLERVGGLMRDGCQGTYTHRALRGDGSTFPVEVRGREIGWKGRTVRLTVVRDVTERERVLARIREREERLTHLTTAVESSNEVIFLTDTEGIFLYVNPAFSRLYEWEAREVVGSRTPRILKSGLNKEEHYEALWRKLRAGETFEGEFKNRKRNGDLVDVSASANPVFDDAGEVIGFLAIQSDISARKRHEETLLAIARGVSGSTGETFFRDLAHHLCIAVEADVAIIGEVVGPNGDHIRTIAVEVDGEPLEGFSYPVLGSPCSQALANGECVELQAVQEKFPLDPGLKRLEAEAYVGTALVDGGGKAMGVALVLFRQPLADATLAVSMLEIFAARAAAEMERSRSEKQRERLEEQLRQAQKMEEIGQLTGGIAHDFQNLLSVILLNTEMMVESLESGGVITLGEVREVESAAQNAANMTRKLLGFGRRAGLSMKATDLGVVVNGMSAMLQRVIPENIRMDIRVGEGSGLVLADSGAVEQILVNLATNARDAMPQGGALGITVEEVLLDENGAGPFPQARRGRYVRLGVEDTGVGMDPDLQSRVFEPFFTTKPPGEGTGLGLAMAYGLAQQQGGFLELESEVGRGTAVSLYLPVVHHQQEEAPVEEPSTPAVGGEETILVVEDQPALRRTLKMVLERVGYTVKMAEDGQEGLEIIRQDPSGIHLVISDLVMPRMGGLELYRSIRDDGRKIPLIMASGYAGKSAAGLAELDPEVPVLKKPWKPKELLRLIREALDRR